MRVAKQTFSWSEDKKRKKENTPETCDNNPANTVTALVTVTRL